MQIQGKIIAILPAQQGVSQTTQKAWCRQEFVLETQERFPKKVCFQVFGADKIQQFNINIGDWLTVDIDIDAHEYKERWYNSINAWNVTHVQQAQPATASATMPPPIQASNPQQGSIFGNPPQTVGQAQDISANQLPF